MNAAYKEQEHRAALWLGWHYWNKEAQRWRVVAENRRRHLLERHDAKRRIEKAWWAMRLCKAKKRWCRADFDDQPAPSAATLKEARALENFSLEQEELKQP
jgi:hypothetical protein